MNPIETLRSDLASRFPDAVLEIDAPADSEAGVWQLDVRPGGDAPWIVVEWKADRGFGVSTPGADDYGTKPDELYPNGRAAYDRVVQLVLSGSHTEPPAAVWIGELRLARGLSQTQVAERVGIKQAAVARIESRDDILLSTLHRIVAALGGTLSIQVQFPEGEKQELGRRVSTLPGATITSQALAGIESTVTQETRGGGGRSGSYCKRRSNKPGGVIAAVVDPTHSVRDLKDRFRFLHKAPRKSTKDKH